MIRWKLKGRIDEISSVILRPQQIIIRIHDINEHQYKSIQISAPLNEVRDMNVGDVVEVLVT